MYRWEGLLSQEIGGQKVAKAQKTAPVAEVDVEDDDLEELDDTAAEEAPAPKKSKKAAKAQPERVGKTTKEVAAELGVTPVRLRRLLRSGDFYPDQDYTRYDLTPDVVERLKAALAAGATGARKSTSKKAKGKKQAAAEEVSGELEELDDLGDDDSDEVDIDTDEDDEDEEE